MHRVPIDTNAGLVNVHARRVQERTVEIEQGFAMGRPSRIRIDIDGDAVSISGRACISAEGVLRTA